VERERPVRAFTVGSLKIIVAMFEPPQASLNMAIDLSRDLRGVYQLWKDILKVGKSMFAENQLRPGFFSKLSVSSHLTN
jgi:hypothetical protein